MAASVLRIKALGGSWQEAGVAPTKTAADGMTGDSAGVIEGGR